MAVSTPRQAQSPVSLAISESFLSILTAYCRVTGRRLQSAKRKSSIDNLFPISGSPDNFRMSIVPSTENHSVAIDQKQVYEVFGVLFQFLATPEEVGDSICMIRGTIPAGIVIPLHCHVDPEIIYILSGTVEVFRADDGWTMYGAGDVVTIQANIKHAIRNSCSSPARLLTATKLELYEFLRQLARPFDPIHYEDAPTPQAMQALVEASAKHQYWRASLQENAAIGITIIAPEV
jgi:quercetin dioxygenase-like cupin family protein